LDQGQCGVADFAPETLATGATSPFAPKGFEISCKERQSPAIGKIFLAKRYFGVP
jgi:hypothetical protein